MKKPAIIFTVLFLVSIIAGVFTTYPASAQIQVITRGDAPDANADKSNEKKPAKEVVPTLENNDEIRHLTLSPDGTTLAVMFKSGSDPFDERIALVDMKTKSVTYLPDSHVSHLLWSPDGKWLMFKKFYTKSDTGAYMQRVSKGEIRIVDKSGKDAKTVFTTTVGPELYFGTVVWLDNGTKILCICTDPPIRAWGKKFKYWFLDTDANVIKEGNIETPLDANDNIDIIDRKVYFRMADYGTHRYMLMQWDPVSGEEKTVLNGVNKDLSKIDIERLASFIKLLPGGKKVSYVEMGRGLLPHSKRETLFASLVVRNIETGDTKAVAREGTIFGNIQWFDNGKKVIYLQSPLKNVFDYCDLVVGTIDGKEYMKEPDCNIWRYTLSPDGRYILVANRKKEFVCMALKEKKRYTFSKNDLVIGNQPVVFLDSGRMLAVMYAGEKSAQTAQIWEFSHDFKYSKIFLPEKKR
ncbi:MAG: hypothetical protein M1269_08355 [Chloroflexi bacterium]|nr:hypothetical protein [Chloroflexota bacterium]